MHSIVGYLQMSKLRAVLLSLFIVMFAVSSVLLYDTVMRIGSVQVNSVVGRFFAEYLSPGYISSGESNAFSNYFDTTSGVTWRDIELDFTKITMHYRADMDSYVIEPVAEGFYIIKIYDENHELVKPLIGFWFTLNGSETRIDSWRLAVLQPFSKLDSEYSEEIYSWGRKLNG